MHQSKKARPPVERSIFWHRRRSGRWLLAVLVLLAYSGWNDRILGQTIHRDGFAGRAPVWLRGEDNVRSEEVTHELSQQHIHSIPSAERIQLKYAKNSGENESFAYYYYPSAPAPISEDLVAKLWLRASRAGVQLQARVVLPKERDPKNPDEPLKAIITGDRYRSANRWQVLEIPRPTKLANDLKQRLRIQFQRDIDFTDAYIDRLILNLSTPFDSIDVFIDDLEIGPVKPVRILPAPKIHQHEENSSTTSRPIIRDDRGIVVRMARERLLVGGRPFYFRAVRYTGTPLKTLRDAGFNSVWFDADTPTPTIEEAIRHGFWIIPNVPLLPEEDNAITDNNNGTPGKGLTGRLTGRPLGSTLTTARSAESLTSAITRFLPGDSVLFWDLGGGRAKELFTQVNRTARAIQKADPQRPLGVDIWDGFDDYRDSLQIVGSHRFPLMTSLELINYRDWLTQRHVLMGGGKFTWTWIQTHLPSWQANIWYKNVNLESFNEPIGPQPEQIRLMTYLGLASGCKGLGFWTDSIIRDNVQGRDRLLMLALLNQEITMLEPLLLTLQKEPTWIDTSHPMIKAAVLRTERGVLVLPVWLGGGAQYVVPQATVLNLKMTVPIIPDGAQPWEISPGHVQSLQKDCKPVAGGKEIVIPEFDLTSAVVFTSDLEPNGLVVKWQDHRRVVGPLASQWARDLARIEYDKTLKIARQLSPLVPSMRNLDNLFNDAKRRLDLADRYENEGDNQSAYMEAMRSLRPLRIVMRAYWDQAVKTLEFPTASPYAANFYTLPQHWQFYQQISHSELRANVLLSGDFEIVKNRPDFVKPSKDYQKYLLQLAAYQKEKPIGQDGKPLPPPKMPVPKVDIRWLEGWTVQKRTLDDVEMTAQLIPGWSTKKQKVPKPKKKRDPWQSYNTALRNDEPPEPPQPRLGAGVLELKIRPKLIRDSQGNPQRAPIALERTFLSINSPPVRLPPGSLVRISGWIRVPEPIAASADGVMMFDNSVTEGLGLRLNFSPDWRPFHFYRRVPASGILWVTLAITGLGSAQFDDISIEPISVDPAYLQPIAQPTDEPRSENSNE